jgi:hypothetical protein
MVQKIILSKVSNFYHRQTDKPKTWSHHHKTFEYSQENSQLKYLSLTIGKLKIFSALRTGSDLSIYRLSIFSTPPFSDSESWEFSLEYSKVLWRQGQMLPNLLFQHIKIWISEYKCKRKYQQARNSCESCKYNNKK